jgi:transcriptional regulator with XRE-family HTH domain
MIILNLKKWTTSEILKNFMFKKNLKSAELARLTGLPQPTVHRIVEGDSIRPHRDSLEALAKFFNITVPQLQGIDPIEELEVTVANPMPEGWRKIPVYNWDNVVSFAKSNKSEIQTGRAETLTNADVNDAGFLIELTDESMYPQFPAGTEIIVNTEYEPMDREMVVVYLKHLDKAFFRMILFNGAERFVRPLNPDLMPIGVVKLNLEEDIVVGVFIEERKKSRRSV